MKIGQGLARFPRATAIIRVCPSSLHGVRPGRCCVTRVREDDVPAFLRPADPWYPHAAARKDRDLPLSNGDGRHGAQLGGAPEQGSSDRSDSQRTGRWYYSVGHSERCVLALDTEWWWAPPTRAPHTHAALPLAVYCIDDDDLGHNERLIREVDPPPNGSRATAAACHRTPLQQRPHSSVLPCQCRRWSATGAPHCSPTSSWRPKAARATAAELHNPHQNPCSLGGGPAPTRTAASASQGRIAGQHHARQAGEQHLAGAGQCRPASLDPHPHCRHGAARRCLGGAR